MRQLLVDPAFLLGIVFACAANVVMAFVRGFVGAAWKDFKVWRARKRSFRFHDIHCTINGKEVRGFKNGEEEFHFDPKVKP